MKRLSFLLLVILFGSCSRKAYLFTSFHEPATEGLRFLYSYDAYHWTGLQKTFLKPGIGNQKVLRDPSIIQGPDGTFHLVWTSSWKGDRGFGYSSSTDLVHWTDQRFISVMDNEPATVNVWAPEIFYDDADKQFIIIWASTVPYKFPKGQEDEDNNHRMYYTTTRDFKAFSPSKLFFDPGFSVIDAVIVKEAKGKYALVLKDNTRPNRNLKVAFSNTPLGPYTNVSEAFTGKFTEGPTITYASGNWLIYYDAYQDKKYSAVKTADFSTFTDISTQISVPENHKHGTIIKTNKKIVRKLIKADSAE